MSTEPPVNEMYFEPANALSVREVYLMARGFGKNGVRSGGIEAPKVVLLPAGTVLFRLYHSTDSKFGQWWNSPRELTTIADYFAVDGSRFDKGRSEGKGIFHATLGVRHDWADKGEKASAGRPARPFYTPLHLGAFIAIRLLSPLWAYHGEGDHAPDEKFERVQKVPYIIDKTGRQRRARQIMLPNVKTYTSSFVQIAGGLSGQPILDEIKRHQNQRLPFE